MIVSWTALLKSESCHEELGGMIVELLPWEAQAGFACDGCTALRKLGLSTSYFI